MQTVKTTTAWPCVHLTTRQHARRSVFARPDRLRVTWATHATQNLNLDEVLVLLSVGELEASPFQAGGTAAVTLLQKGLDLRKSLGKLNEERVILYWHPAKTTRAIACLNTTRTKIMSQENASGIEAFIRSTLLKEEEKMRTSRLWWSSDVPPDFEGRIRGRLPTDASQDTFESVVRYAACWILSEDLPDNYTS